MTKKKAANKKHAPAKARGASAAKKARKAARKIVKKTKAHARKPVKKKLAKKLAKKNISKKILRKKPVLQAKKEKSKKQQLVSVESQAAELNKQRILEALESEKVCRFLIEIGGLEAPQVVREIASPLSAEQAARNAELRVSRVRVVLNKLHSQGLAEYSRVRDENSGWYAYVWNVKISEILQLIHEKEKMMGLLQAQPQAVLAQESAPGSFFACPKGCAGKVSFEEAFDSQFKCGGCGKPLKNVNGKS